MMKKILSLIAAVLFAQAAFAQVCAFQVDGEKITFDGKDLETFSKTCQAYASITALDGKEATPGKGRALVEFEISPLGTIQNVKIQRTAALPGLDKVIIDHLYSLPGYWTPQFVKGQPVNVKVVCPVYGEISQW